MTRNEQLIGFFNPQGSYPTWVEPVFKGGRTLMVQRKADPAPDSPVTLSELNEEDAAKCVSLVSRSVELPCVCFAFEQNDVLAGTENQLRRELDTALQSGRLRDYPATSMAVAEFVGSRQPTREGVPQGDLRVTQARARLITDKVYSIITSFTSSNAVRVSDLLAQTKQSIHPLLLSFADFVVLQEHSPDWGSPPYPSRAIAEQIPLFSVMQVATMGGGNLQGFASWLYQSKPGVYSVVFDYNAVRSFYGLRGQDAGAALRRIYLHELGHMVLHREAFLPVRGRGALDVQAPEMHAEAWFFAGMILSFAAASRAADARSLHLPDDAWQF